MRSLLLLLLLTCVQLALTHHHEKHHVEQVCNHPECVKLASEMTQFMNSSVDPCDDFYEYACGNYRRIKFYNPAMSIDNAHFYGTEDPLLHIEPFVEFGNEVKKRLFEVLLLNHTATSDDADVSELFHMARSFLSSCYSEMLPTRSDANSNKFFSDLLKYTLDYSEQNTSAADGEGDEAEQLLALLVGSGVGGMLSLKVPDDFLEHGLVNTDLANVTRAQLVISDWSSEAAVAAFDFAPFARFLFDVDIAQSLKHSLMELRELIHHGFDNAHCRELADSITVNGTNRQVTVSELQQLSVCQQPNSTFSWRLFLSALLHTNVTDDFIFEVNDAAALVTIGNFLKRNSAWNQSCEICNKISSPELAFLLMDWLFSFHEFLPEQLRELWKFSNYRAATLGLKPRPSREAAACLDWAVKLLQPIMERMYRVAYHPESFAGVRHLMKLLKRAAVRGIRKQEWMSEDAKTAAISKLRNMRKFIGIEQLTNEELLHFYNESVRAFRRQLQEEEQVGFGRMLAIAFRATARKDLDLISGRSDVHIFQILSSLEINAFSDAEQNEIILPMAILAPTVYHSSYPSCANLGSVGYIIGHEMAHLYDRSGYMWHANGTAGSIFDAGTEEQFLKRIECVRNSFADMQLLPGVPASANNSVDNDMSDIIGISMAINALRMSRESVTKLRKLPGLAGKFSAEQVLFIRAAQSWCMKSEPTAIDQMFGSASKHSANHLRVQTLAKHSIEFAEIFKCRPGQPMNPTEKCTFW